MTRSDEQFFVFYRYVYIKNFLSVLTQNVQLNIKERFLPTHLVNRRSMQERRSKVVLVFTLALFLISKWNIAELLFLR